MLLLLTVACRPERGEHTALTMGHAGAGIHLVHAPYIPNSLESIEAACLVYGLDGVEVDVQFTADGEAVLFRSRYMQDDCNGEGQLYEKRYSDIVGLRYWGVDRIHSDQRILHLREFVQWMSDHPDFSFSLDLKNFNALFDAEATTDSLVSLLQGMDRSRFFVESNLREVLLAMHRKAPDIRTIYNTVLSEADLEGILALPVVGVVDEHSHIPVEMAKKIKGEGLLLVSFGQKDQWQMGTDISQMSDVIQVDNPVLAGRD